MTTDKTRTGGEPAFDTDRAWERFKTLAAAEPVPAFWSRTDHPNKNCKEGVLEMRQQPVIQETEGMPVAGMAGDAAATAGEDMATGAAKPGAVPVNAAKSGAVPEGSASAGLAAGGLAGPAPALPAGTWRTERPARRRLRRLTTAAGAAILAAGLFTTPLGDRVLAAMQDTFRIQHVTGIGISADDLTAISRLLQQAAPEGERSFNLAEYGTLSQSGDGGARSLSWEDAEQRMGGSLLRLENAGAPTFQPGTTLTFNLKVKAVNRLLTRLGSDTTLPAAADGQAIRLAIPDSVASAGSLTGHPVQLTQLDKPELTVGEGIDAAEVREAILGLPVLPDNLRSQLAAMDDWRTTLPIPSYEGKSRDLQLNGHDAVMGTDGTQRYLVWLDGKRISLLSGSISDFPTEEAFQQAAEGLIQP